MDDAQYQHAAQLEDQHWQLHGKGGAPGSGKGGSVRVGGGAGGSEGELEERLLAKVAMQLRRELEPRMISHLHNEVSQVHMDAVMLWMKAPRRVCHPR